MTMYEQEELLPKRISDTKDGLPIVIPALFVIKKKCKQGTYSSTGMNKLVYVYTMGNFAILNKKSDFYPLT